MLVIKTWNKLKFSENHNLSKKGTRWEMGKIKEKNKAILDWLRDLRPVSSLCWAEEHTCEKHLWRFVIVSLISIDFEDVLATFVGRRPMEYV